MERMGMEREGDKIDKGLGWLDRALAIVDKYKFRTIFKAVGVLLIVAAVVGFIRNPYFVFEVYEKWKAEQHSEKVELAMRNSQLIQYEMDALRMKTNASRVVLMTFHNQKQTLNGVPYIYLTAQNESLDYGVAPVAEKYEVLKCSLYPFVNYIIQNEYFAGDIESLASIDKSLSYRMMGNDVTHCSIINIEGESLLGVLVVTYTDDCENHNCKDVENIVRKSATKIGILLGHTK
jgi:hypothetical protein